MTADTTAWHHATVDREGDDRLFIHEFLTHQLAKLVDQSTWDAAVALTLGTAAALDQHADAVRGRHVMHDVNSAALGVVVPRQNGAPK